jgi:hypothetical protein
MLHEGVAISDIPQCLVERFFQYFEILADVQLPIGD